MFQRNPLYPNDPLPIRTIHSTDPHLGAVYPELTVYRYLHLLPLEELAEVLSSIANYSDLHTKEDFLDFLNVKMPYDLKLKHLD